jgi:hypothetical protein
MATPRNGCFRGTLAMADNLGITKSIMDIFNRFISIKQAVKRLKGSAKVKFSGEVESL